ncbi:MAG: response regulator [Desulfatitalea sp.]|nr:response regulator [Desulfatitalea sp.]NNJ99121.1 response regulator [Desulfatitalea sp.]
MTRHAVLLVDDEKNVLNALERSLRKLPITLMTATSGAEGLKLLSAREVSLVVSDYRMPNMDGITFLKQVNERHPHTLTIMLTGQAEMSVAMQAINEAGVYKFILKPWNDEDLRITLVRALESIDLADERDRLLRKVQRRDTILGELERKYPGITKLDRDEEGYLRLEG